jgi:glyoxylase-like metal-dependent hydrolase (beta-lactamase superfamily II)
VDAPPNIGEYILAAIASVTDEPITHVIYSHSHADHIASASLYPADAVYIAHEAVADAIANRNPDLPPFGAFLGGSPVPAVTQTFSDTLTLEVGNQTLELAYLGPAHEEGNIFIYAPTQKVLMLVDVIFPGWVPFAYFALAEDIQSFYEAHEQALAYDFETFIGGHLTRLGSRKDVEIQLEYVTDVRNAATEALQTVDFFAIAGEVGFEDQWLLFDTYLDAVAQTCADAIIPNWVDRLGGATAFTYEHCWTAMESLRID